MVRFELPPLLAGPIAHSTTAAAGAFVPFASISTLLSRQRSFHGGIFGEQFASMIAAHISKTTVPFEPFRNHSGEATTKHTPFKSQFWG
jgi:hypothetical protein